MFDFTALVDDNLRERSNISELFVFDPQIFTSVDYFFALLLNDGLVLVADHFFLFLEICHDLGETLLQNLNFVLVCLNFVSLKCGALLILLFCTLVDGNISLDLSILLFLHFNFAFVFLKLISLRDCLKSQRLVFLVNLTLNRLNGCKKVKIRHWKRRFYLLL